MVEYLVSLVVYDNIAGVHPVVTQPVIGDGPPEQLLQRWCFGEVFLLTPGHFRSEKQSRNERKTVVVFLFWLAPPHHRSWGTDFPSIMCPYRLFFLGL